MNVLSTSCLSCDIILSLYVAFFFVDSFCVIFYIKEMQDGTLSVGSRANQKLIHGVPRKFHN